MACSHALFLVSLCFIFSMIIVQTSAQATGSCDTKGAFFSGQYTNLDKSWDLRWVINCDAGTFSAIVAAKGSGWVAFGLNSATEMIGAYVIQAHVDNGVPGYRPAHNVDYSAPVTIQADIYNQVNVSENSTHTTLGFTRPLTLSGDNSSLFSIDPSGNVMLWAYHESDDKFTTQHSNRNPVRINFFTGAASTPTNYKLIHGSLMLLAFGFLAPAGTFVARYLKGIGHPWYLLHISIQYTLLALMVSAFIIIENDLGGRSDAHFQNPHSIIGLTIVILTFVQVLFGILANAFFKPGREGAPFFPDKAHWWLGRLVILYAFANCFIGFDQYGFTHKHNQPYIGFAVWLGLVAILFLIAELVQGQSNHLDEKDDIFRQFRIPIVAYISMFVLGFILYGVTLHEMWNWNH